MEEPIRRLRGDLDGIVPKALEKDRTRRYDTANGLAMVDRLLAPRGPSLLEDHTSLQADRRLESLGTNKTAFAFADSVTMLAVGNEAGEVVVIHPQTGVVNHRLDTGSTRVHALDFGEEDRSLVTVDANATVTV